MVMMVDLDVLLTDAESAPVPERRVWVCVNPKVAEERAGLLAALEQAQRDDARDTAGDMRLGAPPVVHDERTTKAKKALAGFDKKSRAALLELKFTRLPGDEWSLLTSAYPMRVDVFLDRNYGYNYDQVTNIAGRRSVTIVTDDGEQAVTPEQWDRMLRVLSGHDVEQIRDAVFTLNEYEPQQHVAALVKGFGAA